MPNVVFCLAGIFLIARMEIPGDRDILGGLRLTLASHGLLPSPAACSKERKDTWSEIRFAWHCS